jgi:hypothetical protein
VEQRLAEFALERGDAGRQGRLRDVQRPRRPSEPAVVDHRDHVFDLPKFDRERLSV